MAEGDGRAGLGKATLVAVTAAVLGVALYLAASQSTLRLGFPLDDAWIHQTYARNLAERGEWAFVAGEPSGGSTAPLWTVLLAVGLRLGADPKLWAYGLGTVALALASSAAVRAFRRPEGASLAWVLGLALVFSLEWHLVWAAASGMEVIVLVALAAAVIALSSPTVRHPILTGALVGGAIWIRPDAISLVLIPFISIAFEAGSPVRARLGRLARLIAGAALPVLPYLLFNLATAGTIWPSTFYAKQAEYAGLRRASIVARFARVSLSPLVGAGILLLPGAVLATAAAVRSRRFGALGPLLWAGVYLTTFAFLLPVTYQHGRYQIPVVPVLVLLGWEGVAQAASEATTALRRLLTRAWAASVLAATLAFFVLGARAYATDVAVIETEMVEAARWIASHTEPGALVAAHDIGALGFYGERPILDLAGLAEADVIPFLRDEARLAQYLSQRGAAYLMTFPGWYPSLVACAEPVYVSNGGFSPMQGGEHMHIYGWPASPFIVPEGCMLYSPPPDGAASTDDE